MLRDERSADYLYVKEGQAFVTPMGYEWEMADSGTWDLRVCDVVAIHLSPHLGIEEAIGFDDDCSARDIIVEKVIKRIESDPMTCAETILQFDQE